MPEMSRNEVIDAVRVGRSLAYANLNDIDLSGVDLAGGNFFAAQLRKANLHEADLEEANLEWADLQEADLSGAKLGEANFRHSLLRYANLTNADLAKGLYGKRRPTLGGYGPADLREANLEGANLEGAYLRTVDLTGANLREANCRNANFKSTNLTDANLVLANLDEASDISKVRGVIGELRRAQHIRGRVVQIVLDYEDSDVLNDEWVAAVQEFFSILGLGSAYIPIGRQIEDRNSLSRIARKNSEIRVLRIERGSIKITIESETVEELITWFTNHIAELRTPSEQDSGLQADRLLEHLTMFSALRERFRDNQELLSLVDATLKTLLINIISVPPQSVTVRDVDPWELVARCIQSLATTNEGSYDYHDDRELYRQRDEESYIGRSRLPRPLKLFISYSNEDRDIATRIANDLQSERNCVWIDKWCISPGDSIVDRINAGLLGANYFLLLLSKSSVNSRWVRQEWNAALMQQLGDGGCTLIPVLLEDCDIPPLIKSIRSVDFRESYDVGIASLFQILKSDDVQQGEYFHSFRRRNLR